MRFRLVFFGKLVLESGATVSGWDRPPPVARQAAAVLGLTATSIFPEIMSAKA